MAKSRTSLLAGMKKQSTGSYKRAKKVEASAGGKSLYGGIQGGLADISAAGLEEGFEGKPTFKVNCIVVEPEDIKGAQFSLFYTLTSDKFNSYEENEERFCNDMKLLGLEDLIEEADDLAEAVDSVEKYLKKSKIRFVYNSSNKPNKKGYYNAFIEGLEDDQEYESDEEDEEDEEGEEESAEESEADDLEEEQEKNEDSDVPFDGPFSILDKVTTIGEFFDDGDYKGTVAGVDDEKKTCMVTFEDEETEEVPWDHLRKLSVKGKRKASSKKDEEKDEKEEGTMEEGDMVRTTGDYYDDGEIYIGEIVKLTKTKATVKFDDGEDNVPLKNLELDD